MYLGLPFPHNKFLARVSFEALSLEKAKICSSEKLCFFYYTNFKISTLYRLCQNWGYSKVFRGKKMRKCLAIYNLIPEVDWIKQRAHNQRQSRDHAVSSIKKLKV